MLTLKLPVPPSVNAAFVNRKGGKGRGRIKSKAYQQWLKDADAYYYQQHLGAICPFNGPYRVSIMLPVSVRGDIDNRIKLTLDWLVSRMLTPDDHLCQGIEIRREDITDKTMIVTVEQVKVQA